MIRSTLPWVVAAAMAAAVMVSLGSRPGNAAGDPAHGEKVFQRCKACHTLEAGKNKIGPSLAGIFGRKAGSTEGFKYSDALVAAQATIVWDDSTLDSWLANPKKFIPGNRMAFAGMSNGQDRADLIAYLHQAAH